MDVSLQRFVRIHFKILTYLMAFKYRVKTKKDSINEQATPKYYAVPVRMGIINIRQLATILAQRSALSQGDVLSTIIGLIPLIEEYLHEGYAVRLDELGLFSLSASSEGYTSPEECTPHRVKAKKICFRADAQLKKHLKHVKFERDK